MSQTTTYATFILALLSSFLPLGQALAQNAPYNPTTSNIGSTSAQLNWTAASTPTLYDIRWRTQGATSWATSTDIPGTSFGLTGLSEGQAYEWQIRPVNTTIWYGGPASFTTLYSCSAPVAYTPYSSSATVAQLSWYAYNDSGSGSTTSFTLEYRANGATSWSSLSGLSGVAYGTTYYTLSGLSPNTTYTYRVRTSCSPFSGTATFATPACTATNPIHEPQSTAARLRWNTVPGAAYTLQWRPQGGSWNTIPTIQSQPYSSVADYSLTALTPNTAYEWQVQPVCGPVSGSVVGPLSFTANCNTPTSVSVLSVQSNQMGISWNSTYVMASYGFTFAMQHRPKAPANSSWVTTGPIYSSNYSGTFNIDAGLSGLVPNTEYELRVQTNCPNSQTSAFSDPPVSFSTTSCTNTATNLYGYTSGFTGYGFNWSVDYNHYYAVQYRPTGASSWSQVGPLTFTGNSSASVQNLTRGTAYEWRVVTYCTPSVSAVTPSTSRTFTTATCSTNLLNWLYSSDVDFDRAKLYWSEWSDGARQYVVRYRAVGSDTYVTFPLQTAQSLSLTGLANNTVYEWQVAAICAASATSQTFTTPQTFTTSCYNPTSSPYLQENLLTSVQLRWSNPWLNDTYNRTYVIRYRSQGADWTTQTLNATNSSVVLSLSGLQTGTTYEWGVARQCSATALSTYTNSLSFSTSCINSLNSFSTRDLTPTKAALSFSDNAYRYSYQVRYRATGCNDWINSPTFSYSPYLLTGLTPYTTYEWQAAVRCSNEFVSDYSTTQTFNSDCFVPTNLNTSTGSSSLYFYWSSNNNVPSYTVQYRVQGTTDWTSLTTTQSYYQLNNVLGTYEWRVQANCGGGLNSAFSAINTANTSCSSPFSGVISSLNSYGARVSWQGGITGARYTLQWRPSGSNTWNTVADIPQTNYVLTGLVDQVGYEVQVQTQCGNAVSGFSAFTSFTATCSPPGGLSSVAYNYLAEPGRKFSWAAPPNMDHTLRWRRIAADGQTSEEWQVLANARTDIFYPQFLPGTYEWQVQSNCVNGSKSAYVGGLPFEIQPCPNLPITNYQTRQFQSYSAWLTYSASARSEIRWRAVGASGWNLSPALSSGYFVLNNLIENTTYEWQARHLCPDGETTFGALQTFTATCPSVANPRTACVTPYGASLVWEGSGSSPYEVNWRAVGVLTWQSVTVNANSYELTNLSTGTNYEWRIRPACSSSTAAPFSTPLLFTTQCAAPQGLTVVPGTDCLNLVLSWQSQCPASVTYQVRVRTSSSASWDYYSSSYSGLSLYNNNPGGYHEYQVLANCGTGWASNYSGSYYFTSPSCPFSQLCGPATDLTQAVGSSSAMLSWRTTSVSRNFVLRWRAVGGNWNLISIGQLSMQLTGLSNNTLYEWQLRNECAGSNDWSSLSFFRTRCGGPSTEIFNLVAGKDSIRYYFFVSPGTLLEARYRVAGTTDWVNASVTTSPVLLTGLVGANRYELQLRTNCGNGDYSAWSPSRYATTTGTAPLCTAMTTIRSGPWTDTATWSCNRVPLPTDAVQVLHPVTIPDNGTGRALRVQYGAGGSVRFGAGARLLLGQ